MERNINMTLHKQVRMDMYELDIKITSLTAHGHALLTDEKEELEKQIYNVQKFLIERIEIHRSKYERYNSSFK